MSGEAAAPAPAAPASNATPEAAQPAAPVDPLAELDAQVAKAGLKYKAAGKERQVGSLKELLRKAEMADGLQAKQNELLERQKAIEAHEERAARLKAAKTAKERIAIFREYAGDGFDEAAEEAILERIEREKSRSGLTPAERAAREEADALQARLAEYEAKEAKSKEDAERQVEEGEYAQLRDTIAMNAVKALQALGLPKSAVPDAGRRLAMMVHRAHQLGHNLTPQDLAEEAVKTAAPDFRGYTSGLEGDALLEFIGPDVAAKVSKALIAKHYGEKGGKAVLPPVSQPTEKATDRKSFSSPAAAWKALEQGRLK